MSEETIVLDRDNRYKMLGAQNLNGITCFLNATLFAMFCRSDSCFDTLLYSSIDGPVGRFVTMVRLWVNMVPYYLLLCGGRANLVTEWVVYFK